VEKGRENHSFKTRPDPGPGRPGAGTGPG